ncbi:MAG: patatin-like phospholipase family protein [Pseudomonadota bacterium]
MPRNPLPPELMLDAKAPGIDCGRAWPMSEQVAASDAADLQIDQLERAYPDRFRPGGDGEFSILALSGGADNGAYGAGFLRAWSESGTRPEFTIVTGVSTGALSAPFAFLGSDWDDELAEVYGISADQVIRRRPWTAIWGAASVVDTTPLLQTIRRYATEEMLDAIAREHEKGRRLVVQSTSLDAKRPVIWNLGCIAASDAPNRLDVFHKALLASASVPVAFPLVRMEVEANGRLYDELHGDGGIISQTTVLSSFLLTHDLFEGRGYRPRLTMYVIRNGQLLPEWEAVEPRLPDIAQQTVSTMIAINGAAGLLLSREVAEETGFDFKATWIDTDFDVPYSGPFDPVYMKALMDYGYDRFARGDGWADRLFVFDLVTDRPMSPASR